MSAAFDCTARCCPKESPAKSRRGVAEKIVQFHTLDSPWTSRRRIAGQLDVPVRTYHWVRRKRTLIARSSWPKRVARFLETPEGLDFLHRLFAAALLVFVEANDCGLRNLSWFLELSGLDEFIAPSYGTQQAAAEELESLLARFGKEEANDSPSRCRPARLRSARMKPFIRKSAWWPSNRCRTSSSSNSTSRNAMRHDLAAVYQHEACRAAGHRLPGDQRCGQSHHCAGGNVPGRASLAGPLSRAVRHGACDQRSPGEPDACRLPGVGEVAGENRGIPGEIPVRPGTMPARLPGRCVRATRPTGGSCGPRSGFTSARPGKNVPRRRGKDWAATIIPIDLETGQPLTAEEVGRRLARPLRHARPGGGRSGPFGPCPRQTRQGPSRLELHAGHHRVLLDDDCHAAGSVGIQRRRATVAATRVDSGLLSASHRGEGIDGPTQLRGAT